MTMLGLPPASVENTLAEVRAFVVCSTVDTLFFDESATVPAAFQATVAQPAQAEGSGAKPNRTAVNTVLTVRISRRRVANADNVPGLSRTIVSVLTSAACGIRSNFFGCSAIQCLGKSFNRAGKSFHRVTVRFNRVGNAP
ncbi:MAG: hypothetical protein KDA55_13595, partial [Planctomycetales bacterium]|nr:hypothetical protein [Planctomycetales bacterium]